MVTNFPTSSYSIYYTQSGQDIWVDQASYIKAWSDDKQIAYLTNTELSLIEGEAVFTKAGPGFVISEGEYTVLVGKDMIEVHGSYMLEVDAVLGGII